MCWHNAFRELCGLVSTYATDMEVREWRRGGGGMEGGRAKEKEGMHHYNVCATICKAGNWDVGAGNWDVGAGNWDVGAGNWDVGAGTGM